MKVLITNSGYKHTLGAIRSLGKKGFYVIGANYFPYAQAFYSKYCKEKLIYPNPQNSTRFIRFMLNYIKKGNIDVLLPIGYDTTTLLSYYKEKFTQYTNLPIANYDSMKIACDKNKTMKFAENLGINVPKSFKTLKEIDKFPVVIKGIKESGTVQYVFSKDKLDQHKLTDYLIQEYIPGDGYGFFALFNKGKPRAYFMHKRLRENPPSGGPSTSAESIFDNKLKEAGLKLLKSLNWHGVAMVEFKKDLRDGKYKLMEINPKFWGSLDLAIASGIDFPYLTTKMAIDGDIKPLFNYKVGLKFRWLFPDDILHVLAKPSSFKDFFLDFFDKRTKSNIWLKDIKPNLFQIRTTIQLIFRKFKNRLIS